MNPILQKYDWILKLSPSTEFVVFDTETTGLQADTCRIIELGAIKFLYKCQLNEMNSLINPGCSIPWQVSKVNNIYDKMVKDSPFIETVLQEFLEFLGDDTVLIAHNAPFDIEFVNAELKRLGKEPLKNRVIDTRFFAKDLLPGKLNYKLQTLAENLKIEVLDAHRASDDAKVCMKLFLHCIRELFKLNREEKKLVVNGS